jgi:4,5-dihydroxyphthalate decarboxylase
MVRPEGIDLRIITLPPSDIFLRMCRYQEFDVSEMSMGSHCYLLGRGDSPFVGIPAFLSRAFRHSMVYFNVDAGIEKPEDLNGKRIAIREWGITAVVWIIGILTEEYGLDMTTIDWVAVNEPRVPLQTPENVRVRYLHPGENISDMLESGDLDAAFLHQMPPGCFKSGSPKVQRMFPDYKTTETDYYQRTGIHPIMHCVVLRKDIYQRHQWALRSLYKAFCEARQIVISELQSHGTLFTMIPFLPSVMDETLQLFGPNFWPYGVSSNVQTLEKFVGYAHQQSLTPRTLGVEALFGESVLEG